MDDKSSTAIEWQDDTNPAVRNGWQIDDLGSLGWALERMGELQAEIAQLDALKIEAIARVESRTESLTRRARTGVAFFEGAVLQFMARARTDLLGGGKKKSRALPTGTVGWRTKAARLVVTDEAAALAWAKDQPVEEDLVRVKYELNKKLIDERFKTTGEVPPGCEVQAEEETPYVKPEIPEFTLSAAPAAAALKE